MINGCLWRCSVIRVVIIQAMEQIHEVVSVVTIINDWKHKNKEWILTVTILPFNIRSTAARANRASVWSSKTDWRSAVREPRCRSCSGVQTVLGSAGRIGNSQYLNELRQYAGKHQDGRRASTIKASRKVLTERFKEREAPGSVVSSRTAGCFVTGSCCTFVYSSVLLPNSYSCGKLTAGLKISKTPITSAILCVGQSVCLSTTLSS